MSFTYTYTVSFEFPTRSPETLQGTCVAGSAAAAMARATRAAQAVLPTTRWTSCVCVLLDRKRTKDESTIQQRASDDRRRQVMLEVNRRRRASATTMK